LKPLSPLQEKVLLMFDATEPRHAIRHKVWVSVQSRESVWAYARSFCHPRRGLLREVESDDGTKYVLTEKGAELKRLIEARDKGKQKA
jgi:hypothetical protein